MSYDISLVISTGPGKTSFVIAWEQNCNYNYAPPYQRVMAGEEGIKKFDGKLSHEILEDLSDAIITMRRNADYYEKTYFEFCRFPARRGSYPGCVGFLEDLREACRHHPITTVRVR